jgi:hypothetical protein
MFYLPVETWERLAFLLAIGLAIYFLTAFIVAASPYRPCNVRPSPIDNAIAVGTLVLGFRRCGARTSDPS